mgnify:FL=1
MEEQFDLQLVSKLRLCIGEVADITEINQRKLRYWEEKGIITSSTTKCGGNKLFDYVNIKKITLIKEYLEEGFTLQASVKKADERLISTLEVFDKLQKENL